jgi:predicted small secreted protein
MVMTKRIVLLLFAAAALVVGSVGCRTAHGAGEDIENAGQAIQEHTPP